MNPKQFLDSLAYASLLLIFAAVVCAQQTSMPPKSEDRPLKDRIASMERDEWQKPDEAVKALDLKNGTSWPTSAPGRAISAAAWRAPWHRTERFTPWTWPQTFSRILPSGLAESVPGSVTIHDRINFSRDRRSVRGNSSPIQPS